MANHRWDTEPPDTLPSRLAARRRAAGQAKTGQKDGDPWPGPGLHGGDPSAAGDGDAWVIPSREGIDADSPNAKTGPGGDGFAAGPQPEVLGGGRRRWRFPLRAGILAACLMLAAAAAVPLLRDREAVLAVDLGAGQGTGETAGERSTGGPRHPGDGGSAAAEGPGADIREPAEPDTARGLSPVPAGDELVVHVAGAVATPGLVRVPLDGRVADAVSAAGGATGDADLTRVNLAAPMTDGSMVVIPAKGDAAVPAAPTGAAGQMPSAGPAGPGTGGGSPAVNLNTAGESELQTLPRVGPVLAARIIAWRTEHGPFQQPEDLDAVPGIGEAMLAALLPLVAV
ncbi:ComEA family DNA-binding protein [Arthrobacter gandavensis]|uniref:ComEA family DNA-binding protein n=1 Tax=Arthrobacter gandavensis TaxID=169960 RepID=UPI00188E6820|nr:ComEA family DNA-binding protein [Arthrobacter gandavensis]MBF4995250.1 ComEA family DNA-binding protein [Arthrobacter gandavensis]